VQTEKKLSQAESDELVRQLVGGKGAVREEPGAEADSQRVVPYDFRGAQRLARDQIRGLASINKTFTRSVSTLLAHRLREAVAVDTSMVQQMSYPEFTRLVPSPCLLAVYTVSPLELSVVVQFDLKLIFLIYDRLCGGPGKGATLTRELSDLEMVVIRRYLLNGLADLLAQAWDPELRFELVDLESNPFYLNLRLDQDQIVLMTYEVRLGDTVDTFNVIVPYEMVERILPKSPHRTRLRLHRKPTDVELERLQTRIGRAMVRVDVVLGKGTLPVSELLELRRGDIIPFDRRVGEPLTVNVNGIPKFEGVPGLIGRRLGVRITRLLREEIEE